MLELVGPQDAETTWGFQPGQPREGFYIRHPAVYLPVLQPPGILQASDPVKIDHPIFRQLLFQKFTSYSAKIGGVFQ